MGSDDPFIPPLRDVPSELDVAAWLGAANLEWQLDTAGSFLVTVRRVRLRLTRVTAGVHLRSRLDNRPLGFVTVHFDTWRLTSNAEFAIGEHLIQYGADGLRNR